MNVRYVDAHCHVQFGAYDPDRDALLARMKEAGVAGLVVGCDLESSKKAVALAEQHEHLFASVGLHPNHEADEWFEPAPYEALAAHPKVVAIGECGLDYFRSDASAETKAKQRRLFADHVALAAKLDQPLIIHARPAKGTQDAYRDLIALLAEAKRAHPNLRGDVHFFAGGVEELRELNALGFTVSYTAVITFARDYDDAVKAAPLGMLLAETDAPYVAPASRRGSRNDPLAVIEVAAKLAEVRGEDPETVRRALAENARALFHLKGIVVA